MSADNTWTDPYRTPDLPAAAAAPTVKSSRPGVLTAICVVCIVIGALGVANGAMGTFGAIFSEQIQKVFVARPGAGMPPELQKIQQQYQDESVAILRKFFVEIIVSSLVRIVVALALLYGGILCLGLKEPGRRVLLWVCLAAVAFEIAHTILQSLVNMEMMTAVNAFLEGMVQTLPQRGSGRPISALRSFMQIAIMAGMVITYIIALIKITFYGYTFLYLQRPTTRALFAAPGLAPAAAKP
jgi:hypothetical protein